MYIYTPTCFYQFYSMAGTYSESCFYCQEILQLALWPTGDPCSRTLRWRISMVIWRGGLVCFFMCKGINEPLYIYTQSQAIPNWGLLLGIALYFVSHIERCWFSFEHVFNSLFIYIYIPFSLSLSVSVLGQPHLFFLVGCTCHKIWEAWQARRGEETSSRLCGEPELWDPPHSCWRKWFFAAVHDQEWHQATWIYIYIIYIYIIIYICIHSPPIWECKIVQLVLPAKL